MYGTRWSGEITGVDFRIKREGQVVAYGVVNPYGEAELRTWAPEWENLIRMMKILLQNELDLEYYGVMGGME